MTSRTAWRRTDNASSISADNGCRRRKRLKVIQKSRVTGPPSGASLCFLLYKNIKLSKDFLNQVIYRNKNQVIPFFLKGYTYICNVFFIVLDLRLTRSGYRGIPFFCPFVNPKTSTTKNANIHKTNNLSLAQQPHAAAQPPQRGTRKEYALREHAAKA